MSGATMVCTPPSLHRCHAEGLLLRICYSLDAARMQANVNRSQPGALGTIMQPEQHFHCLQAVQGLKLCACTVQP